MRWGLYLGRFTRKDSVVCLLGVLTLLKVLIFSLMIETPQMGWEWQVRTIPPLLFASAGILAVLLAPALFFRRRISQLIYGVSVNLFFTIVILANRFYHMFFQSFISFETVLHSHEALSMSQALFSTIRFWELLWLADLLFVFCIVRLYSPALQELPVPYLALRLKRFGSVFCCGFVIFALSLNYTQYHRQQNINIRESGLLLFYIREAAAFWSRDEETMVFSEDIKNVKEWFALRREVAGEGENMNYYGQARGKNLIVLQVEALQEEVIGKKIGGQEITPNLNRIKEESVYFSHCFDQVDMATADAEILVNLSLFPLNDVSVYMRYPDNAFNSLANLLRENGYAEAAVFHGFRREFYNREEVYPVMGFNRYFSRRNFEKDEVYKGLLGDKTFLKQTASLLERLDEPYYAFIITLTSHHPFNYLEEADYEGIDPAGFAGTIVGDYIRSIHYTDAAIGMFLEMLEQKGILDDSLLVIYGDHVAFHYNEIDWEALNEFFGADMRSPFEQLQRHRVPLFIRFPGAGVTKIIHEYVGMIDIYPTLANLLAMENHYLMGRDLFNTEPSMVILKRGSYIKDNYLFHAPKRTIYDLETGAQRLVEVDHDLLRKAEETLSISEKIYRFDFFRQLEQR